jgi:hypothetical protein
LLLLLLLLRQRRRTAVVVEKRGGGGERVGPAPLVRYHGRLWLWPREGWLAPVPPRHRWPGAPLLLLLLVVVVAQPSPSRVAQAVCASPR